MFFDFYINWRPLFSWSWVAGSMLHVFGSRCSKPVSKLLMFPFFLIVRCLHQFCTLQVVALRLPRTISWTINATKTFPVWGHNWITLPLKNLIHFSLVFILLPFYSDFIQRNSWYSSEKMKFVRFFDFEIFAFCHLELILWLILTILDFSIFYWSRTVDI